MVEVVRADAERRRAELDAELASLIRDAEADDVRSFNAAITAGWTPAELRRIGLEEPQKTQRVRKRAKASARRAATQQVPVADDSVPAVESGDQGVNDHE